jgi:hypothetical protein
LGRKVEDEYVIVVLKWFESVSNRERIAEIATMHSDLFTDSTNIFQFPAGCRSDKSVDVRIVFKQFLG